MDIEKIKELAENFAAENEFVVVKFKSLPSNVIEIYLDSMDGVAIDKCIELNRIVGEQFDRDVEDYELTVSSASISEPFSHPIHFQKNIGRGVEIHTLNSTKLVGVLQSADDEGFTISYTEKVAVEGKKRKIEQDITKTLLHSEVREVKLSFKI